MKKTFTAMALLAAALLLLCACAETGTQQETAGETAVESADTNLQELTPVDAEEASDTDVSLEEVTSDSDLEEAPASDADSEAAEPEAAADPLPSEDDLVTAQSLIGHPVEELYEALGEPAGGAQYSKSCMDGADENAQDGMLYYDTFSVWTYKTDDSEIIEAVYEVPAE